MFVIMKNYDKLHHAMFDVVRNNDEICCFSISLFLAMFDVMRDFENFFFCFNMFCCFLPYSILWEIMMKFVVLAFHFFLPGLMTNNDEYLV